MTTPQDKIQQFVSEWKELRKNANRIVDNHTIKFMEFSFDNSDKAMVAIEKMMEVLKTIHIGTGYTSWTDQLLAEKCLNEVAELLAKGE